VAIVTVPPATILLVVIERSWRRRGSRSSLCEPESVPRRGEPALSADAIAGAISVSFIERTALAWGSTTLATTA
jgi:hypothetical protein